MSTCTCPRPHILQTCLNHDRLCIAYSGEFSKIAPVTAMHSSTQFAGCSIAHYCKS